MKVLIGSARINEQGTTTGGQDGDQTGKECCTEKWYLHKLGWVLIRPKDSEKAKKIAHNMVSICDNDNIGYDWNRKNSLYDADKKYNFDASKVKVKCNTNCAGAVRNCVLYAGIKCEDFYTGNEIEQLQKTGEFDIVTDKQISENPAAMRVGDILVTPTQGHTVVVVEVTNDYEVYCDTSWCCEFVTTGTMNLRIFAGTKSEIVGAIPSGQICKCDGIFALETAPNKRWYHLHYNNLSGFGSEVLLKRK